MDPRRWGEIQSTFDALIVLDASERGTRLTVLASIDPELGAAVEALLGADIDADKRLAPLDKVLSREPPPTRFIDPLGMFGRTIAHFELREVLGAGGMGVVYRAQDTRLGRPVALKFLSPACCLDDVAKARFLREAQAAASLDHPNLCTIHEVGTSDDGLLFMAMALYEGETLRARLAHGGALPVRVALDIARQIAEGLRAAHGAGIVHRDLKPGNIMLLPNGSVRILDFGLAKARDQSLTTSGEIVGTVSYMAPEQIRGDKIDARADLWSLGVVLYEMLTNRTPFASEETMAIAQAILTKEPAVPSMHRVEIPIAVDDLVLRLLEKNADDRLGPTAELLDELARVKSVGGAAESAPRVPRRVIPMAGRRRRRLGAAVLTAILISSGGYVLIAKSTGGALALGALTWRQPSARAPRTAIAVLPLENLTGDPRQQNFADAMHDAVIAELAQIRALTVLSRQSVLRFRNTEKTIPEIARDLNVDALIQGSVFRAGDTVRITVRVVQARPAERQVWAQSFQRDASGVLGLQGEVARAIAEQIQVDVTPDELGRLRRSRQINPAAYQAWLRAWATMNGSTNFDAERCIAHGEEAATTDSTYAPAYALTALCYDILPYQTQTPPRAAFPKARAAALRAIRLDPSLGSAYVALGLSLWLYDWDWVGADRAFRRAIELAPSEGQSHWWYGFYLATMGRHTEAVEQARQAELLSPGDPGPRRNLAMVLYLARRYDEAIDQAQRTIELAPQVGQNYDRLAHAYEAKGMYEAAANAWTKAVSLSNPGDMYRRGFRARSLALAGHRDQARATLTELLRQRQARYVSPTAIAHIYLGLGELDEAISWLEQAYEMHDPDMSLLKTWPVLDPLRSNPRFQRLLNRMNFPPSSG